MSDNWKINKEVNVGELITMISILCIIIGFFVVQDRRIERNTMTNDQQAEQINEISHQIEANRIEQKQDINRLDSKLDDIKTILIQGKK